MRKGGSATLRVLLALAAGAMLLSCSSTPAGVSSPESAESAESAEPSFRLSFADPEGVVPASADPGNVLTHEVEMDAGANVLIKVTPRSPAVLEVSVPMGEAALLPIAAEPEEPTTEPSWLLLRATSNGPVNVEVTNAGDTEADYVVSATPAQLAEKADVVGRWAINDVQFYVFHESGAWDAGRVSEDALLDQGRWEVLTPGQLRLSGGGTLDEIDTAVVDDSLIVSNALKSGGSDQWVRLP